MAKTIPIALFVYARPEHTRLTLSALSRNPIAEHACLYVFADGPADSDTEERLQSIREVREIVNERQWCGEVTLLESDTNQGLAPSIVGGVTQVCDKHGRAIVLEDDLETSPGFLSYMCDALDLYENEPRVMQISAFNVPNRPWASQTGFLRVTTSWGWATWQRAWQSYRNDAKELLAEVDERGSAVFDLDGYSFHREELERNARGDLNTWAVKWYASVFLQNGLCLYPRKTLVRNLGFDGSGENCFDDALGFHRRLQLAKHIRVTSQPLVENEAYLRQLQHHYRSLLQQWTNSRLRDRVINKAKQMLSLR